MNSTNSTDHSSSSATKHAEADSQVGRAYWEGVSADNNGMLGGVPTWAGFSSISRIDLQGSRTFLARLGIGSKSGRKPVAKAVDGGAGIGRITQGLLLHIAESVDVVEPISKFTEGLKNTKGVGDIFNIGLEDWKPAEGTEYDLIWTQWCVGHLKDDQLVYYLERCKSALRPESGLIVIKENLSTGEDDVYDEVDGSVTRRDETFRELFKQAGLNLIRTDIQRGLPESSTTRLMPVRMYALKP